MSINKVILIGRLGKDLKTRYMTSGEAVTNAGLATSEIWKDKSGEKQEKTEWHNLVFYRRLAEIAGEYLKKDSMIYVEGKLQTRKYTDKAGIEKYSTEIVVNKMQMLCGKQEGEQDAPAKQERAPATAPDKGSFDYEDEIPFN